MFSTVFSFNTQMNILTIGSWCRHLVVLEHQVLKIPVGLPVEAAATVSVNPCTAFRLLKDFEDLEPGNPV